MRYAVVLAGAIALAGCGGEERLSRDEYIAQADEICDTYDKRLDELGEPESLDDLKRILDEGLPIAREGIERIKELKPPEELQERVDEWHELNDRNLDHIEDLGAAAEEGDSAKIQSIAKEADDNEQEADRLAREIGLEKCAEDE